MARILAHNLGMGFNDRSLFRYANLSFCEGDCIYLMGDNGSGKTTLMKILAGLYRPTSGSVVAEGFASRGLWQKNKLNGCAVYLHQHPYLFDGTVQDNLALALTLSQAGGATNKAHAMARALDMARLGHLANSQATHLSGGERQRLAIARAWLLRPRLLMLDEPVSNMDKESRELVQAMTAQLKADGAGLLITSHQHGHLTSLCTSRWHIRQGEIHTDLNIRFQPSQEPHYALAN